MSTTEEKVLAVLRAARKRLHASVKYRVSMSAMEIEEVDHLLIAGEDEMARLVESGEQPTIAPTAT